ncbi:MAG: amidophosphoribosyltransferase, partial [Desulfobacterales bacterium]|nr:amidophosphoribosyltransferase [Desulfobacterales bacterium]
MTDFNKPRESCGIFGIHGHHESEKLSYFGLYALQHRVQESAGIAVVRDGKILSHKG